MKKTIAKIIGDRIRQLRAKRNLSQEDLSFTSQLHRTYIGAIERGEKCPTVETLLKITQAMEVSLSNFLENIESEL